MSACLTWHRNLESARQIAEGRKKDLLIAFTSHGGCHTCTLLDQAVFRQPGFAAAGNDFELVEIDNRTAGDVEGRNLAERYRQWKREYRVHLVPTIVLADSMGRPYAYTGYEDGLTPQSFLEVLKTCQAARQARDRALVEAGRAAGVARANKLHAAISAVEPWLGKFDDRGDDPVVALYGDLVAEIRRLDSDNVAGLAEHYDNRLRVRDEWLAREAVFKRLDQFKAERDFRGAIVYIDETIPGVWDEHVRWRLEWARQVYLEWDDQFERALERAGMMRGQRLKPCHAAFESDGLNVHRALRLVFETM